MPVPYSNNLRWRIVRLNAFLEVEAAVVKYMHICTLAKGQFTDTLSGTK